MNMKKMVAEQDNMDEIFSNVSELDSAIKSLEEHYNTDPVLHMYQVIYGIPSKMGCNHKHSNGSFDVLKIVGGNKLKCPICGGVSKLSFDNDLYKKFLEIAPKAREEFKRVYNSIPNNKDTDCNHPNICLHLNSTRHIECLVCEEQSTESVINDTAIIGYIKLLELR